MHLPEYPAVHTLQWISGGGVYRGVAAPGWYRISPPINASGRPWPTLEGRQACEIAPPDFELRGFG